MNFQPGSLYSQVISAYSFAPQMTICLGDGVGGVGNSSSSSSSFSHVVSSHSGILAFGAVQPLVPIPAALTFTTPLAFTAGSGWYTAQSFINVAVVGLFVGKVAVLSPVPGAQPLYNFFIDTGTAVISYPPGLLMPMRAILTAALQKNALVASVKVRSPRPFVIQKLVGNLPPSRLGSRV